MEKEDLEASPPQDAEVPRSRVTSFAINYLHLDPDKILSAYGTFGKFQMLTYFITSSVHLLFAINMMVMPFITADPKFNCRVEPPENVTWEYTILDKCTVLDSNNWSIACKNVPSARYVYDESSHDSMASEFNLVCDDLPALEHGSSIFMLGGMIGAPLITQMADLFGRRPTFLIPLYITVVANFICAVAPTYNIFLLFRFISGMATSGFSSSGYVLCLESVATEFRDYVPFLASITWVLGYCLAGVFHLFISDWRWLYIVVSLPGLLTIPFFWFTPESIHWLVSNGKRDAIHKYIFQSSRFNGTTIALHDCKKDDPTPEERKNVLDIFRNADLLFQFCINSFILIVMNGTYWALSLFSTDLSEDHMTGFFLSGLIELPAGLFAVFLLRCCPRKAVSISSLFLQGICMIFALYLPSLLPASLPAGFWMMFPLLAKCGNVIVWSSQPLIYEELAPTSVRTVFGGLITFSGEFGSVLAPYLKRLELWDKRAPALVIAVLSLISAGLCFLLPETKGKQLKENFDDMDGGPFREWWKRRIVKRRKAEENSARPEEHQPMITISNGTGQTAVTPSVPKASENT